MEELNDFISVLSSVYNLGERFKDFKFAWHYNILNVSDILTKAYHS